MLVEADLRIIYAGRKTKHAVELSPEGPVSLYLFRRRCDGCLSLRGTDGGFPALDAPVTYHRGNKEEPTWQILSEEDSGGKRKGK